MSLTTRISEFILLVLGLMALMITAYGQTEDVSCYHCHSKETKDFAASIHYNKNIICTDCHGGDTSINGSLVSTNAMHMNFTCVPSRLNQTEFCSKCHEQTTRLYEKSIHWQKLEEGRTQAPACTDCHGTHNILSSADPASSTNAKNISLLCANCHENQTKMQAMYYGIKTDRFDTYKKSYHYKSSVIGGKVLATCPDCHENHDTKPASDPESAINPKNLPSTCGKAGCHPGANNVFITGGRIHEEQSVKLLFIDAKKLVTYFYIVMIIFELTFTFGLILLGITSKFELRRRK